MLVRDRVRCSGVVVARKTFMCVPTSPFMGRGGVVKEWLRVVRSMGLQDSELRALILCFSRRSPTTMSVSDGRFESFS